jgi:hypothetical protein
MSRKVTIWAWGAAGEEDPNLPRDLAEIDYNNRDRTIGCDSIRDVAEIMRIENYQRNRIPSGEGKTVEAASLRG